MWTLRHRCGAASLMLHDYSRPCAGASASHSVAAGGSNRCRASPTVCQGEVTDRIGSCPGASPAGPCSSKTSSQSTTGPPAPPPHWLDRLQGLAETPHEHGWVTNDVRAVGPITAFAPVAHRPAVQPVDGPLDLVVAPIAVAVETGWPAVQSCAWMRPLPWQRRFCRELYALSPLTWSGRVPGRPPSGRGTLIRSRT